MVFMRKIYTESVITRWATWIEAAIFYTKQVHAIREVSIFGNHRVSSFYVPGDCESSETRPPTRMSPSSDRINLNQSKVSFHWTQPMEGRLVDTCLEAADDTPPA
ncbi:uncharacterized protein LOC143174954 isoform X2 [Nomia melanderi]|uniref:uncharacterized protein LOC143174954 isoform X2 n=1 Tax=Nomia melanderi TaxID=2448451 RepID=UPI003FCC29A2